MKNETINTTEIARLWNTHQDAVKNFLDKKNVAAVAQMKFGRGTMRLWDKGVLSLTDEFSEYKKKLIENSREASPGTLASKRFTSSNIPDHFTKSSIQSNPSWISSCKSGRNGSSSDL